MPSRGLMAAALAQPGVRVRTLVRIRWIAIVGQLVSLALTVFVFGYPLPLASALAAVGAAALLNVGLIALYHRTARLVGGEALLHLGFDLVQVGTLLFLTGGLSNPFAVLLIVPVTIASTLLSARAIAVLLVVAFLILIALSNWALPLPWTGHPIFLPTLYRLGILIALLLAMAFLSIYAWQVSQEARRRQLALIATQSALERETKMSALGSLAAAAAHELGGPLGTITLIARDLEAALKDDPSHGADARLLVEETRRARAILTGIARRAEAENPFPQVTLPALLYEAAGEGEVTVKVADALSAARVARSPELLHGLGNLVSNARRHARSEVRLIAKALPGGVEVRVADDGPGFPEALLPKLGEPFLGPSRSSRDDGTGLGIFIATTLLERTGASMTFGNGPEGGAEVAVRWRAEDLLITEPLATPWPALSPTPNPA